MENNYQPYVALTLRFFAFLIGFGTLLAQFAFSIIEGFGTSHFFNFFTIQTNIIVVAIFFALLVKTLLEYVRSKTLIIAHIIPSLHLASTCYITVTMLIFWLVLVPMSGAGSFAKPSQAAFNIILHSVVPILALIDTGLFILHGSVKYKTAAYWVIYPLVYYIHLIIVAHITKYPYFEATINGELIQFMYPYPILDPQLMGVGGVVGVIIGFILLFVGLSMLYVFVDKKLKKD